MLLVDQNKAVIVGKLNTIVKELAFLVDKLSEQGNEQGNISSEKVMDLFYEEVAGFQKDRERGIVRDHPHDEGESLSGSDSHRRGSGKKERATAAEAALIEAMKEIQEMRADKEKALKKKEKKDKKKNKKEK